jgi:HSP20 family protein
LFLGISNKKDRKMEGFTMILRKLTDWPTWGWRGGSEELDRMRKQMDWLTDSISRRHLQEPSAGVFPLINVTEDSDQYYVRAELPGIKADALEIFVTAESVSIAGERETPTQDEKTRYHRSEREFGKFSRIASLPDQVDTGKVEAYCTDGILTVILPKAEAVKPKKINVKAS